MSKVKEKVNSIFKSWSFTCAKSWLWDSLSTAGESFAPQGRENTQKCSWNSDPEECELHTSVSAGTDPGHPQILLWFQGVKMHQCAERYQNTALPQAVAISGAVLDLAGKAVYTVDY